VAFYLVLTFMPTYLSDSLHQSETSAGMMLVVIQAGMAVVIVLCGRLSDKIGRKPMIVGSAIGFTVLSIPAVAIMDTGNAGLQFLGLAILGLLLVALTSVLSATLTALFPTHVRYSGLAFGYNVATAVFGGTAGLVVQWLIGKTGIVLMPGIYLTVAGVIGLIAGLCIKETAGQSLRGTAIPGTQEIPVVAGQAVTGRLQDDQVHDDAAARSARGSREGVVGAGGGAVAGGAVGAAGAAGAAGDRPGASSAAGGSASREGASGGASGAAGGGRHAADTEEDA